MPIIRTRRSEADDTGTESIACEKNQKIIVSKDNRESRTHRAVNPSGQYLVRHYRLDGDLVKQQECCDFLVLNDTHKNAYYIELKGRDIRKAVSQLLAAEQICRPGTEWISRLFQNRSKLITDPQYVS